MYERRFQKKVIEQFRAAGAVVLNKIATAEEGPGWPDLWVGHRIWSGWLELKMGNAWPTPVQTVKISRLVDAGVPVFLLRCDKIRAPSWNLQVPVVISPTEIEWRPYSSSIPHDAGILLALRRATALQWKTQL